MLPLQRISRLLVQSVIRGDRHRCLCTKAPNDKRAEKGQNELENDSSPLDVLTSATPPAQPPDFPSDLDDDMKAWREFNRKYRRQDRHAFRPNVDPRQTSIFLFPGQGSQFVGMGRDLLQYPGVEDMYKVASQILGYNLLDLCLDGPQEELDRTVHCQSAVLVTALAAVEKLRHENPKAIEQCISTAGFSVGEYAALTFADAMSFEDAIRIVKKRAKLMQKLSEAEPSGMMTCITGADAQLKYCLHTARLYCQQELGMEHPVCNIAISLYPEVKVIAGHEQALAFVEKNGREFGIRRTKRLPVSGAFHTKLMKPASKEFAKVLEAADIREPLIPVYSNANARRYKSPKSIRRGLVQQLYEPVMWEQTMHVLYSRPKGSEFPATWEMGPGNQLGTMLKQTNKLAFEQLRTVTV